MPNATIDEVSNDFGDTFNPSDAYPLRTVANAEISKEREQAAVL